MHDRDDPARVPDIAQRIGAEHVSRYKGCGILDSSENDISAAVAGAQKADLAILERILAGGLSKMIEAGCTVIGGHSIRDEETKFGYSVTGVVHPKRILANIGTLRRITSPNGNTFPIKTEKQETANNQE